MINQAKKTPDLLFLDHSINQTEPMYMNKLSVMMAGLMVVLVLTSCALRRDWSHVEQLGLGPKETLIFVPYNPEVPDDNDRFALYYFTLEPLDMNKPTVLFVAGGPGIVVREGTFVDSLRSEYNIVYFHVRGSGFSQVPETNSYDEYLRTRYAVDDIERIRENLRIPQWHAIVSYSYGTVLAQQYAGKYGPKG